MINPNHNTKQVYSSSGRIYAFPLVLTSKVQYMSHNPEASYFVNISLILLEFYQLSSFVLMTFT